MHGQKSSQTSTNVSQAPGQVGHLSRLFTLQVGKQIDSWLEELSAERILKVGMVDEDVTESLHGGRFHYLYF